MIDLEIAEGVAFITLNAPATKNALNNELAAQFVAACDEADRDPRVGAAVIFGEEISGLRAVQLGLAWEAVPTEQVEERAAELARRAARDPELARKATASLRTELGPPRLPWAAALEVERGAQLWSLRRRVSQ